MRISVVTPSFCASDWLKLCVASVADQGVEVEHIVQDGGSNDGTLDWLPGDSRVKSFVEADAGMYDAINRGLRRADGDILGYLNCDEQYLPGALGDVLSFFREQAEVDVLFADAVIIDAQGDYLWHRKVLTPLLYHTWTHPLATLSCSMFFRRRVITERKLWFDSRWRYYGDSDWILRLLKNKVSMAVLRRFTSAFTHTGRNLSLNADVSEEAQAFFATAPLLARTFRRLFLLHHRLRRLMTGIYFQKPFSYSVYTRHTRRQRVNHCVTRPTFRWKW